MTQEHDAETVEAVAMALNGPQDSIHIGIEKLRQLQEHKWNRQTSKHTKAELRCDARAAISAMPPREVTGWQPIETAPDMERLWVCGWQPKIGRVMGYWWYHEDVCDAGVAIEHPNARYWSPIVIPLFPPTNWDNLPPVPEAK